MLGKGSLVSAGLLLLLVSPVLASSSSSLSLDQPFEKSFARLNHAACVTLFHRKGRIGCGTEDREVQTGRLVAYSGTTLSQDQAYVAVVEEFDFSNTAVQKIKNGNTQGLLKGILVLNSTSIENDDTDNSITSPDSKYPQGMDTPSELLTYGDNSHQWNARGDGLMLQDLYGIPTAYVKEQDVSDYIRAVAKDESDESASIVAEFQYYMGPDEVKSHDCLSWRDIGDREWRPKCLPLGGTSVWGFAGSPETPQEQGRKLEDSSRRAAVMLATSIDATSMFHDSTPGANAAASNIMALLMAAKLIGESLTDEDLDALPKRILFGFFQGEAYGFIGSRAFLRDVVYPGFQCNEDLTVPSSMKNGGSTEKACLNPMRPSLEFMNIASIAGMVTVDQVGIPMADDELFVHNDGDGSFGNFLANILLASSTNDVSVAATSAADNGNGYPWPPTPLTSLLQLTQGGVSGAVLSGYDYAFSGQVPYHSHLDSIEQHNVDLGAIAASATLLARTALAGAYDQGDMDYATAAAYAAEIIPELSKDNETLVELADCLLVDGNCDLIRAYASTERFNERDRTGLDLGEGVSLGTPPNYYTGIYESSYGQPFVQVGDRGYGAYDGSDYGKKKTDTFAMRPRQLEMAIRGLMNDFLGRGSLTIDGDKVDTKSCKSRKDCSGVAYCSQNNDAAVCSGGGECVCLRAHYHSALDEAIVPAANNSTGYFDANPNDDGISAMYTEPYWSSDVGVRVYRSGNRVAGIFTLVSGLLVAGVCAFYTVLLKVSLKKEKLY